MAPDQRSEETYRLNLGPERGAALRAARRGRGLGLRATARRVGIGHGYLTLLEDGARAPSGRVAEGLVDALALDPVLTAALCELAERVDAGRAARAAERAAQAA